MRILLYIIIGSFSLVACDKKSNDSEIKKLQKQIADLSKKTLDTSVLAGCVCTFDYGTVTKTVEHSAENLSSAIDKIEESCKAIS